LQWVAGNLLSFSPNPAHLRPNVWDTRPSKDPHPIYHVADEEARRPFSDAKERVVNKAMPVIKYQEFIPHPVLQDYVKRFWILEKESAAEDSVEEVTPEARLGEVIIQARKTYVSLVSPRRTFARVQATTKNRVDLGLRLEGQKPVGRLAPSRIHETMQFQISLTAPGDFDSEALEWLQKAYDQNR